MHIRWTVTITSSLRLQPIPRKCNMLPHNNTQHPTPFCLQLYFCSWIRQLAAWCTANAIGLWSVFVISKYVYAWNFVFKRISRTRIRLLNFSEMWRQLFYSSPCVMEWNISTSCLKYSKVIGLFNYGLHLWTEFGSRYILAILKFA